MNVVQRMLYSLTKRYPKSINICWTDSDSLDLETGALTQSRYSVQIPKCLVLPVTRERDFVYALTFIASNKNFTYGGFFDTVERWFYFNKNDIEITPEHWIVFENYRYEVVKAEKYEGGWRVLGKQVTSAEPQNVISESVWTRLRIEEDATDVIT